MNPKDRCLAALEAQRIMREMWSHAGHEHERMLIENVLVTMRAYLVAHCKEHHLPLQ